jgi:DNA-3-methyladenine glycosylase
MSRLPVGFYQSNDVAAIARELIGKVLITKKRRFLTSGIITETEAYHQQEKACHAYNGRRTSRTEVLFGPGGWSYVYLCYGIHYLFNITTGTKGEAAAVLIRSIEPCKGLELMLERRGLNQPETRLTTGPGNLTKALGISFKSNGVHLTKSKELWIESRKQIPEYQICTSRRIGVDYAEEDALLPWRFYIKNSKWVSKN